MNLRKLLPQVFILSTQRSGTHLLESFLKSHHGVNGRGEIFLRLQRSGIIEYNDEDKVNVGILMYNQLYMLRNIEGDLKTHKIIHLVRNPYNVALSRLQMEADKKQNQKHYRAHRRAEDGTSEYWESRGVPNKAQLSTMKQEIEAIQIKHQEILRSVDHLHITYEDMVPTNETVLTLDPALQYKLCTYLGLSNDVILSTDYIKTGIF